MPLAFLTQAARVVLYCWASGRLHRLDHRRECCHTARRFYSTSLRPWSKRRLDRAHRAQPGVLDVAMQNDYALVSGLRGDVSILNARARRFGDEARPQRMAG